MNEYLLITIFSILPALISAILLLLGKCQKIQKIPYWTKQIIIGVIFGLLAVAGTEFGVLHRGAVTNVRDAAVLSAGLLFGGPAGIIAGLIGGIERFFAVMWGIGTYTQIACTVSTIAAGFISAALRKFMFDNKKPGWLLSMAIGFVVEVFHMTMVLLTNLSDTAKAMGVIEKVTPIMVPANALSVGLSVLVFRLFFLDVKRGKYKAKIAQTIQNWLLITIVIAFLCTMKFFGDLEDEVCKSNASQILIQTFDDIKSDIETIDSKYRGSDKNYAELLISSEATSRHAGNNGIVLISSVNGDIISAPSHFYRSNLKDYGFEVLSDVQTLTETKINGEKYYYVYDKVNDYYVFTIMSFNEVFANKNIVMYSMSFCIILIFALLFVMIYMLIKNIVVKQINKINESLAKITAGDLNEVVKVRQHAEFASLSDDINETVDTLKGYIKEAAARIDKELEYAKTIQYSSLPTVFPEDPQFDLYASMHTAKEVGGDFYDFQHYNEYLNFLIADVSGKGIPASLFMMRAKSGLRALTESGLDVEEVFIRGNNSLCSGNDGGMFVTAWQGKLNLNTGLIEYANAGHNPPLVKHGDGEFEYIESRPGLVLAGMEGIPYKRQELKLEPGDIIYIYTDGVTEATNVKNELYGEDRLKDKLNSIKYNSMKELCDIILEDVNKFTGVEVDQFDDITMMAVKYLGPQK